jgi:hypothetical protein
MAHTRDRGVSPPSGRPPEQDRKYLKKNDYFPAPMISAFGRIANQTLPLTLPALSGRSHGVSPLGHSWGFSGSAEVHSVPGDVIKGQYRSDCPDFKKKLR